jgi:hypothetical protein
MAEVLGIDLNATVGASSGAESSHTVSDMNIGETTYLEIYDKYDVHTGAADKWDSGGHVGVENFELKVPSSPKAWGTQVHKPYGASTPPPTGNNG